MIWESRELSLLPVWILLLTGDSRHIWQTCRSTMSTRQMASTLQMRSKEPTLTTTNRSCDLYITDSTCEPTVLSSKTGEDAASEFALGEAVFYQNGTWAYNDIKDNEVADEDLGMLPIYIGVEGEENQGLCTGSENYWCVNNKASEADIQATLDFMNWVISSDEGSNLSVPGDGLCNSV